MRRFPWIPIALLVLLAPSSWATQYVVTNTASSGPGSLRDAINSANTISDPDTILFSIPGSGPHLINDSGLILLQPVLIDGYSQPGAAANTNPGDGSWNGTIKIEVSGLGIPNEHLFSLGFPSSELRGLALTGAQGGYAVWMAGNGGHRVAGCYVGLDPSGAATASNRNLAGGILVSSFDNRVGGTDPDQRNVIANNVGANIEITGEDNWVRGNIIGLAPDGVTRIGSTSTNGFGVKIIGDNNLVGGAVVGGRNTIANCGDGVWIDADGNAIRRNRIGTDVSGTIGRGSVGAGIRVQGGVANVINGRFTGGRNDICDNTVGIVIESAATGTIVRRNNIGVGQGGVDLGNLGSGLRVSGSGTKVGGSQLNDGNHIAYNLAAGVAVLDNATGVTVRRNRIHDNGTSVLGIDLEGDGVTPNDPMDADGGSNGRQNYPVITDVAVLLGDLQIVGTLESTPNTSFAIEFFSSGECDPTGHGEGDTYLDRVTVVTDGAGFGSFDVTMPLTPEVGDYITATATDPAGSTSEFSQCMEFVLTKVVNANDSGYGSLRRAIEYANAFAGVDTISFGTEDTIRVVTPLPPLTETVMIGDWDPEVPGQGRISGLLASPSGYGLWLQAQGCGVRGVSVSGFADGGGLVIQGYGCLVEGSDIGGNALGILILGHDNHVKSNWIGSTPDGRMTGNGAGISILGDSNFIGGGLSDRNYIMGSEGRGIWVGVRESGNVIEGNHIGHSPAQPFNGSGNGEHGINVAGDDTTIGGPNTRENVIAMNGQAGVAITAGVGNQVLENFIWDNGGLGIDLGDDGVTSNDAGDTDIGPNNLLNYPVLSAALMDGPFTTVCGTYSSTPGSAVSIDFYTNDAPDTSGYGEGQAHVGSMDLTLDGTGTMVFRATLPSLPNGLHVTATARGDDGTSEFSRYVVVENALTVVNTNSFGPGSLWNALVVANACLGIDTIRFDIPGPGPHFIEPLQMIINDPVFIDGYSQPGAIENSAAPGEPNNAYLMIEVYLEEDKGQAPYLTLNHSNATIRGIAFTGGNSANPLLLLGGTGGHTIEGCRIGVDPRGAAVSSAGAGIHILVASEGNVIGGPTPSTQNVIAGAVQHNIVLRASSSVIQGNLIGVLPDGVTPAGSASRGILFSGAATGNLIGGSLAGQGNVISGHTGAGIELLGSENDVVGNYLGTDVTGTVAVSNGGAGIRVWATDENRVGGPSPEDANLIAFNGRAGVEIFWPSPDLPCGAILVNRIHSNDGLAIDLGGDGVTPNDPDDVWVDYPAITSALGDENSTTITGDVFGSTPGTYTVHFYANADCDPSGNGEAETYLGSAEVELTSPPSAPFEVFIDSGALGSLITATATRDCATSELSSCVMVDIITGAPGAEAVPLVSAMYAGAPNPFRTGTTITYDLAHDDRVEIVVFDVRGARVRTLLDGRQPAARRSVSWDGRNDRGARLSPGVYFVRFQAGDVVQTRKLQLLR